MRSRRSPGPWAAALLAGGLLLGAAAPSRSSSQLFRIPHRLDQEMAHSSGVNLTAATKDIVAGLPVDRITLVYDHTVDARFRRMLVLALHRAEIMTESYSVASPELTDEYTEHVRHTMAKYEGMTSIIFSSRKSAERLISAIRNSNLIQRNILYMFYCELWPPSPKFLATLQEAMRVAVISNPRPGTYRVYYTQATPEGSGALRLVNWWSAGAALFRHPVLPPASRVYTDLRGRTLSVPVLHKPPWNFVTYTNKTFEVEGGRDHELLSLLAEKLHFQFNYFDPPERSQGSAFVEATGRNKTFPGILGLISERRADMALGDVTITFERSQAVEFSFLTLADSGAFVTKTPSRLNEALALVRPFQREVWPVLVLTILLSGPLLFGVLEAPRLWRGKAWVAKRGRGRRHVSDMKVFWGAVWFSIALFFKQSVRGPEDSHRVRLLTILLSFAATYVIGDMYSANLTSMLARPGRERPISNLEQLAEAMETRGYQLLVEKHSSSYNILENGTGVYERLWQLMQRQRLQAEVESGEDGMQRVGSEPNLAMLGGRETLYFDTRRFGANRFHLSEKLFTRYSAIALQIGCPYIESINNILMQLFEAGILTKMTEEEYEKLGDKLHDAGPVLPERTPAKSGGGGGADEDDEGRGGEGAEASGDGDGEPEEPGPEYYDDYSGPDDGNGYDARGDQGQGGGYGGESYEDTDPLTVALETTTPPQATTSAYPLPGLGPGGVDLPGEGADSESASGHSGRSGRNSGPGDDQLKPISIKMLQGAFYALVAGYLLATLALWSELTASRFKESECCPAGSGPGASGTSKRAHSWLWLRHQGLCPGPACCAGARSLRRQGRRAKQHAQDAVVAALAVLRACGTSSDEEEDDDDDGGGESDVHIHRRHPYLDFFWERPGRVLGPGASVTGATLTRTPSSSPAAPALRAPRGPLPRLTRAAWGHRQPLALATGAVRPRDSPPRSTPSPPSSVGSISCIRPFIN